MPPRREPYDLAPGGSGEAKPLPGVFKWPTELESSLHYCLMHVDPPKIVGGGPSYLGVTDFAFPMPKGLTYRDNHTYEDISMSSLTGGIGSAVSGLLTTAANKFKGFLGGAGVEDFGNFSFGPIDRLTKLGGVPILTAMEVAYSNTPQRSFVFAFQMTAKNADESEMIYQLVQALRYYAAPYTNEFTGAIWGFIAPWTFTIKFYHEGGENPYLPKIHKCALTNVDTDFDHFSGGNWSAFEGTGAPVAVHLTLQFKEFEVSHKDKVILGY